MLVALDLAGIACSLGSTCASGSTEPAPVLVAMGCPPEIASSSVRFSLGNENTLAEIDEAVKPDRRVRGPLATRAVTGGNRRLTTANNDRREAR